MPTIKKIEAKKPVKKRTNKRRLGRLNRASFMGIIKDGMPALAGGAGMKFLGNMPIIVNLNPLYQNLSKVAIIILTGTILKQKSLAMGMFGQFGGDLVTTLGFADGYTPGNAGYGLPGAAGTPLQDGLDDGLEYDTFGDHYPEMEY